MLNNIKSELAALRVFQNRHEPAAPMQHQPSDESKWSPPRNSSNINALEVPSFASIPPPPPPPIHSSTLLESEMFHRLPAHVREETQALLQLGYSEDDTLIQTILSIHK